MNRGFKDVVKRIIFGDTLLPRDFTLGLPDPQNEVSVWLQGLATPLDVTHQYSMACTDPFTICIAFAPGLIVPEHSRNPLTLQFCERGGPQRLLGQIGLKPAAISPHADQPTLRFFEAVTANIYCLARRHLWAHSMLRAFSNRKRRQQTGALSVLDGRAMIVNFIRPHTVVLVSALSETRGTMFPMNITGDLGDGRFGLALQAANQPARIVEAAGRIAVSTVPLAQAQFTYRLSANHSRKSIDWGELPFATKPSTRLEIPVPVFALRVREMEIEQVYRMGRHTFFVARIVSDERLSDRLALHTIHGYYQTLRLKGRPDELAASLLDDASNKS